MYYLGHRGSHQLRHYQHLDIAGIGVALVRNEVCKFVSCVQKPILCSLHVTGVLRLPQIQPGDVSGDQEDVHTYLITM